MDNLESIDKYLISEIDGMETTPSGQVWNSIDTKLQARKAGRNGRAKNFKLLSAAAILIVATALVIVYNNSTEQNRSIQTIVAEQKNESSTQKNTPAEQTRSVANPVSIENAAPTKNTVSLNKSVLTNEIPSKKSAEGNEQIIPALNNKQESPVKTEVVTSSANEGKKDHSDKDIILLPYFSPGYAGTSAAQTNKATPPGPSVNVKNDLNETPKTEPRENTIYMPSAFTPNGDGLNDVFLPQTAETPSEYKLSVFDRTGNLVFYSEDIQKGWDGRTNHNGVEDVKEDVYIWRIEMKTAKGEKRHLMGSLTLLK